MRFFPAILEERCRSPSAKTRSQLPAIASMALPTTLWLAHYALGWEIFFAPLLDPLGLPLPHPLMCAVVGVAVWAITNVVLRRRAQSASDSAEP